MNFKVIFGIVAVTGLMGLPAVAQVTVSTTATTGKFQEPYNVVEDSAGDMFVSDSGNNRIVRIDGTTSAASVLTGVTGKRGSNDGPVSGPTPAHLYNPQGLLVVSLNGTNGLLVADSGNNSIRFVRFSDGYITTVAGQNHATTNGTANEIGANATFNDPVGMDQDPNGNVYIADELQNAIRVINLRDPLLGVTNLTFSDGTTFQHPTALAFVGSNQLWVADSQNNSVKLITLATPTTGSLTTYVGGNSKSAAGSADSLFGPTASLANPSGLLWIPSVGLLISDTGNNSLRLATNNPDYGLTNYALSTYAGISGTAGAANGSALAATFNQPEGLCLDPNNGAFLLADLGNNEIRSLQYTVPRPHVPSGVAARANSRTVNLTWNPSIGATNYNVKRSLISGGPYTLTGSPTGTNFTDSTVISGTNYYYVVSAVNANGESANSAEVVATPPFPPFNVPQGIAVDNFGGSLFITDYGSNLIHLLNLNDNSTATYLTAADGILHPVSVLVDANDDLYVLNQNAGTNGSIVECDPYGNIIATNLTGLNAPTAFTMDGNGNIFITELAGAIKVLFPSGASNTIVTLTTNLAPSGTNVQLQGIAIFDDGALAVSDSANEVIWTINPNTKQVVKLTGQLGVSGTTLGASNLALLNQPHQLARTGNNQLLIADYGNNRLVTTTRSGAITNVLVSTNSQIWLGFATDPAVGSTIAMTGPAGVAVSSSGQVYDSEPTNALVRALTALVTAPPTTPPIVALPYFAGPQGLAFDALINCLLIADYTNNAVQRLDFTHNTTTTFLSAAVGILHPVAVCLDTNDDVYVLNQNAGTNGSILKFDHTGNAYGPIVTGLNQPTAFTMDGYGTLFVTEQAGTIRAFGGGVAALVATITNANVSLQGIALFDDGTLAVSDAGSNVLWTINPITKLITQLTGQFGTNGAVGASIFGNLSSPEQLVRVGGNQIIAADSGNNRLVLIQRDGTIVTNNATYQLSSSVGDIWFGEAGDPVASGNPRFVPMVSPVGLAIGTGGEIFASETYYDDIRGLTGTGLTSPAFNPIVSLPLFATPQGLAFDNLNNSLLIADYANSAVQQLDLNDQSTAAFLTPADGILHPSSVLVDTNNNIYVLNQNQGTNGSIVEYDPYGNLLATNLSGLQQPTAFTMDGNGNIFIAELAGAIKTLAASGTSRTMVTLNGNVQLQGIAAFDDGVLAVSDSANQVIWTVNPITKSISQLTGQLGTPGNRLGASNLALLNQPHQLARVGNNQLVIADSGNNRLVIATRNGTITNVLASANSQLWLGRPSDPSAGATVAMTAPTGVAVSGSGQVFDSEPTNVLVRGLLTTVTAPPATSPVVTQPLFDAPQGLAFDSVDNFLFIADAGNNAVQRLNLNNNATTTFLGQSNGLSSPVSVLLDTNNDVYVLNQNAGTNGSILKFDITGNAYGPLVTGLNQPTAFTLDGYGTLLVVEQAGNLRAFGNGVATLVTTITNANVSLQGIALFDDGTVALSDAGNQVIWTVNPITKQISQLTGQLGANGAAVGGSSFASLAQPQQLLRVGGNQILAADSGNNRLVLIQRDGTVTTNNLNSAVGDIWFGQAGDPVASGSPRFVPMVSPVGLALGNGGELFTSETSYEDIRGLTGTAITSPTANPGVPLPYFGAPQGLALDSAGKHLFIADLANNAVEQLNLSDNATTTFLNQTNGLSNPASVLLDTNNNVYVLNQNAGTNGFLLEFDPSGDLLATNLTGLNQPTAFTMDGNGNIFIAELAGAIKVLYPSGAATTIITLSGSVQLQGIAVFDDGVLAVSDAANQVIWTVNPATKQVAQLTGQLHNPGNLLGLASVAQLNQPHQLARAGNNQLLIADYGNNRLVTATRAGTITNVLSSANSQIWLGQPTDPAPGITVALTGPAGVAVSAAGLVYDSEPAEALIRGLGLTATVPAPPTTPAVVTLPLFATPQGLAFDSTDNYLFIADAGNNAVQRLDLDDNATTTFLGQFNGLTNPVSVLLDTNDNVYVLNQGTSSNGFVLKFDIYGNAYGPVVTRLNQPTAFLMDGYGTLFITEQAGRIRAFGNGVSNLVATITNNNVSLQGIALFDDGTIAVSDAGNDLLWTVNPITKLITQLTGQFGTNAAVGVSNFASLSQPQQLVRVGGNQIIAADYGNNRLVLIQRDGTIVTNNTFIQLNSSVGDIWFGQTGDPVANGTPRFVPMLSPFGVAIGNGGEIFASETHFDDIRGLTSAGLTSPTFNPGVPLPYYVNPAGIALNNEGTVLYVTDPTNNTVSALNLANNQTTVFLTSSSGIYQPIDVASDTSDNIYVLNQGTGGNGSIMEFDKFGNFLGTNAASLALPTAMTMDFSGDVFVTELNGLVQEFNSSGSNTLAHLTNANVQLEGIAVLDNGTVVVSDAGNQVLWQVHAGAVNTNAVLFTGVLGASGTNFGGVGAAKLNQPMRLARALGGLLLIADSGNNRVVVADDSGTISQALNATNATLWFGLPIDPVNPGNPNFLPMLTPVGLAIGPENATNGIVYTSENVYKDIRGIVTPGIVPAIAPPPAPLNLVATPSYGQVTLTWSAALGATNYNVLRSSSSGGPYTLIGTTTSTTFTDYELGGSSNYYVVSAENAGGASPNSAEVLAVPLTPPPPAPIIGWFDYQPFYQPLTVLYPVAIATYNNDELLAIDPVTNGVSTYYTTDGSTPALTNGATPPFYQNGLGYAQPLPATTTPVLTIKAINIDSLGQVSPVTTAEFLFQVANPTITGNNAGQFTVSDLTTNAQLYYTVDGTDPANPTNGTTTVGPISLNSANTATLSLQITSNTLFKVRGYRTGYSPSGIAAQAFSTSNFVANVISFGFASGEASSAFIAAPGQTFYAPVTLSILPGTAIYSLQFDVTVTNAGPTIVTTTLTNTIAASTITSTNTFATTGTNVGITTATTFGTNSVTSTITSAGNNAITNTVTTASTVTATTIITNATPITTTVTTTVTATVTTMVTTTVTNLPNPGPTNTPGAFGFKSMLLKPDPANPGAYFTIPPYMFIGDDTAPLDPNQIINYEGTNFVNLLTTDTALNLLGVGWIERAGATNLYLTPSQDLIRYSQAHDDMFPQAGGQIIVGGYSFVVPPSAKDNQTYQLQISRPSATSDGIGTPGSDVYIAAPTNGSTAGGAPINAFKYVTIGQKKYIAGSVYPFRWFNAGDFGSSNLVNADVEQVFQSAIYDVNAPPPGSDFFDAMDSSGGSYVDLGNGYLEFNTLISSPSATAPLFGGDDTSINQIAFGDGVLDVCDVYVTFRRSLDPSLTWFARYWNNGQRVAVAVPNVASHALKTPAGPKPPPTTKALNTSAVPPQVNFTAGQVIGSAGQTVKVPINATILGNYPLRLLMLNLSVEPLDGSPPLTAPVAFSQTSAVLGTPYATDSRGNGNFAAAWLNSTNTGLIGTVTLGTLLVTIPASATSLAAYAIHFDHASASPNGLAAFPNQKFTGLLTTTTRTNSTYGDGIPDSWRLQWFGTIYNVLSASNACPTGDGVPNWEKYVAGVDPNVANDFPSLNSKTPIPTGSTTAIHWPSVVDKQYVIQRASSLFGSPWTILSTNTGTGGDMEYDDTNTASVKFYRVEILP